MSDKEIVQYYGQIWGNVKHMKSYVKELRERYKKENEVKADFKPIHFFNHSTNESFQIITREGLIDWVNDFTENHNAFDTYEELKERCLEENEDE